MKRFHVHAHVEDLDKSIAFYAKWFGAEPTRVERDYAEGMLEDRRINFAISTRGTKPGVDPLGNQADSEAELQAMQVRAQAADRALHDEGETTCCDARSDKVWISDSQGIAWEQFHTLGEVPVFSERQPAAVAPASACCATVAPRGKPVSIPVQASSSCC